MDKVKLHNLDRSPIFMDRHVKQQQMKVEVASAYLREIGGAERLSRREGGSAKARTISR